MLLLATVTVSSYCKTTGHLNVNYSIVLINRPLTTLPPSLLYPLLTLVATILFSTSINLHSTWVKSRRETFLQIWTATWNSNSSFYKGRKKFKKREKKDKTKGSPRDNRKVRENTFHLARLKERQWLWESRKFQYGT